MCADVRGMCISGTPTRKRGVPGAYKLSFGCLSFSTRCLSELFFKIHYWQPKSTFLHPTKLRDLILRRSLLVESSARRR